METIDFDKMPDGLVPAVVQDAQSGAVLMLGYMNAEALEATRTTGLVTFYSRSKQRLWQKGETSGNTLRFISVLVDCDGDALLVKAIPAGPVCHTGADTCWGEQNSGQPFLKTLEAIIAERSQADPATSYTARLRAAGIAKMAQKVGEEAVETVIEALGNQQDKFMDESADLMFHFLVLLAAKGVALEDVEAVLQARHQRLGGRG
ncbi:MAG: bifunctional phosphoribosyl-AMP cyclohydrolase/phosphoribosyl-ATP diphosphatase HisIE [Saprospiraceae bacterium]|nr:bifunctional phosphoribosyl-AMP cyclohydrolase/phosphoribosyl-ATP diphosphatase HisIE [Saprospiraceae bacterium]